ncbi:MAG: hypothetical protein GXP04_06400, partial [Alphaproteobacteria bacterium]|nr:hypothetical protein [Alphaproteobacteria bacterium]
MTAQLLQLPDSLAQNASERLEGRARRLAMQYSNAKARDILERAINHEFKGR